MIMFEVGYRSEFRVKIIDFCDKNNIYISYLRKIDSSIDGDYYNIHGDEQDINSLNVYVEKLEKRRKAYRISKCFLWRLFN